MNTERVHWTDAGPVDRLGGLLCSSTGHAHRILTPKKSTRLMNGIEAMVLGLINAKASIAHAVPPQRYIFYPANLGFKCPGFTSYPLVELGYCVSIP